MGKNKWFGTDGVRGVANQFPMTADFALRLGQAAAVLCCRRFHKAAIAKDTRVSCAMLEAALTAGLTAQGIDVVRLGVIPTPAATTLTPELGVDMTFMITASHNPYQDNGIKLIAADGNKFSDDITSELEALIEKNDFAAPESPGRVSDDTQALARYKEIALSTAADPQQLAGLKIVLDCANGCFSNIMPEVFERLGAEVICLGCRPDGTNINRDCGSQHPQAMLDKIKECSADLGIAVDGDGDRIKVGDDNGQLVKSEQLIAFLAQYLELSGHNRSRPIVSTVLSNTGLEKFVTQKLKLDYYSTPVGERHVVAQMRAQNGAVGGEESGHIVLLDYSHSGDALMVALVLAQGLKNAGRKMSRIFPLFENEPLFFENPRLADREQVKAVAAHPELQALLTEAQNQLRGIGRAVIHPSGTEPLIRVWVCGADENLVQTIGNRLLAKIRALAEN